MGVTDIPNIHDKILKFLLEWRKKNPGFTFNLRKSDLSKRLSSGYWFHGNDNYIAISFWTGIDWQSKIPNISFIVIPETGECYLQFSTKDSNEKDELIKSNFKLLFQLDEASKAIYYGSDEFKEIGNYLKIIEKFLTGDKIKIDEIISRKKKEFETKQNPQNRIGFITEEDFRKNLKRIQKYQKAKSTKNLPISLYEIEIENYGLIKKLKIDKIPPDAQWIFLTGENGSGKTTILKALATALTNSTLGLGPRTSMSGDYSIGMTMQKNGKKSIKQRIKKNTSSTKRELQILSKGLVCIGPVRLNVQELIFSTPGKSKMKNLLEIFNRPHIQLFSTISPLIDIGYVYNRNLEISKQLKNNKEKLKFIMNSITTICSKIVDISFTQGMKYYEVDNSRKPINKNGTTFQNLASGYKSIVAMVSHMMLHLYYQQPDIDDPALLEGIVIIDEIDLHFHPKMQRQLVIKLSEIFPRIQFIASTHSPIPLLGAPANTPIFISKIDSENGIHVERMNEDGEISNLLPNSILTSPIFNLQEIVPESHLEDELLNTEDNYNDVIFYKMLDKKINTVRIKYNKK